MFFFALAVLMICLLPTSATYVACGTDEVDLTSLMNRDLSFSEDNYTWWHRPCGVVTSASNVNCTNLSAMVCRATNTDAVMYSYMGPLLWLTEWKMLYNGVQLVTRSGYYCPGGLGGRMQLVHNYICQLDATTAFISEAYEINSCASVLTVQTNLACPKPISSSSSLPRPPSSSSSRALSSTGRSSSSETQSSWSSCTPFPFNQSSSTAIASSTESDSISTSNDGLIVGTVLAVVFGVGIVGLVIWLMMRRSQYFMNRKAQLPSEAELLAI